MEYPESVVVSETRMRSLVKSVVYRIISIIGTAILSWVVTGDIRQTISITIVIQIFLIALYYSYERVWNKIKWGRKIQVTESARNDIRPEAR